MQTTSTNNALRFDTTPHGDGWRYGRKENVDLSYKTMRLLLFFTFCCIAFIYGVLGWEICRQLMLMGHSPLPLDSKCVKADKPFSAAINGNLNQIAVSGDFPWYNVGSIGTLD